MVPQNLPGFRYHFIARIHQEVGVGFRSGLSAAIKGLERHPPKLFPKIKFRLIGLDGEITCLTKKHGIGIRREMHYSLFLPRKVTLAKGVSSWHNTKSQIPYWLDEPTETEYLKMRLYW
jgi:hypothetical protein